MGEIDVKAGQACECGIVFVAAVTQSCIGLHEVVMVRYGPEQGQVVRTLAAQGCASLPGFKGGQAVCQLGKNVAQQLKIFSMLRRAQGIVAVVSVKGGSKALLASRQQRGQIAVMTNHGFKLRRERRR